MPAESLDAPEDLSKEDSRQVAFGELEDEGPGGDDEAHTLDLGSTPLQSRLGSSRTTLVRRLIVALPIAVLLRESGLVVRLVGVGGATPGVFEAKTGDLIVKITEPAGGSGFGTCDHSGRRRHRHG